MITTLFPIPLPRGVADIILSKAWFNCQLETRQDMQCWCSKPSSFIYKGKWGICKECVQKSHIGNILCGICTIPPIYYRFKGHDLGPIKPEEIIGIPIVVQDIMVVGVVMHCWTDYNSNVCIYGKMFDERISKEVIEHIIGMRFKTVGLNCDIKLGEEGPISRKFTGISIVKKAEKDSSVFILKGSL